MKRSGDAYRKSSRTLLPGIRDNNTIALCLHIKRTYAEFEGAPVEVYKVVVNDVDSQNGCFMALCLLAIVITLLRFRYIGSDLHYVFFVLLLFISYWWCRISDLWLINPPPRLGIN